MQASLPLTVCNALLQTGLMHDLADSRGSNISTMMNGLSLLGQLLTYLHLPASRQALMIQSIIVKIATEDLQ